MKKKMLLIIALVVAFILLVLAILFGVYQSKLGKVSNNQNDILFEIKSGSSTYVILQDLKDLNLIKDVNISKIYVKLHHINNLQAGKYYINESMSTKQILAKFSSGDVIRDEVSITFVEGKRFTYYVKNIANNFSYTEEEILNFTKDEKYLNKLIDKYWFITKDILNSKLYYPLEGYMFPDTYNFSKDASIEDIFDVLINSLAKKLDGFKKEIEESKLTVHEILTLASIVELEGAGASDRAGVAGVFYNRINDGWSLGSDVTTYYAEQKDFSEELTINAYNKCNAYNTRGNCFRGLPVGPICSSSLESLLATINPDIQDYYYFVADKNKKTYFAKNNSEFNSIINTLKSQNLWYTY